MASTVPSFVSSGSSVYDVSEEKTNGTKLIRLLVDVGTHVLRSLLHSVYQPDKLQVVLNNNKAKLKKLKSKGVIFQNQWKMLFPASGDPPDSEKFDITLLHLLLREVCHLTPPSTGWHNKPAEDDNSLAANISCIKYFRNELCHSVSSGIPNAEFEDKWKEIVSSLETIEMYVQRKRHVEKMEALKNDPIDHDTRQRLKEQAGIWKEMQEREKIDTTIFSPHSCLPDKISEESIFGRDQEIKEVKDMVESGVAVVLITGGPGFGKTTVAKRVAHELAKPNRERTVLFCSLLTKTNFNEVAVEMINSCGTVSRQVTENPGQWLKDWSKGVQNNVTFVLDNVDGVLESSDRTLFISILSDVRRLSRQKVTFVVTARKTFGDPNLQSREVRLDPLSTEKARDLLISRVQVYEDAPPNLSRADYIANDLCGCVPLALCIVGSLLSDYSEETLIESLEKEPLAVLQDDQESVEKAIKTSFDLLKKPEQEAFILLSLFQGSFDPDAAKAVMKAPCSSIGTLPISVLRSLKNRSLVEKLYSRRYQIHPLIHAYARKISQDHEYANLLAMGEKLACVHFMSRLSNNADIYWSKDNCRDALVSFQEDKYNFEYFLTFYTQGREKQDKEIVCDSEPFLDSLPQKCMYLERCLHPRFYTEVLERLSKTFDSRIQPVCAVDLLCLLGNEYKRKGEQEKYQEVMEEAEQIRVANDAAFAAKPLSEVYFHNSNARFLSSKRDFKENRRIQEETAMALKVSDEQLHDHPEKAATLYLSGNTSKRSKQYDKAKEQLKEALELFQRSLGKHFMTAETLKAIGDLHFFLEEKSEADFKICPEYYKAALEMFDDLGVGGSKESILTLKNFGICHTKSGNFEEAMNLLSKAEQVSERELEENHTWKVYIKTSLAFLHDEMNNLEQAIDVMRKGLVMGKKLNLPIDKMRDKDKVRKFLSRYPEKFPEADLSRNVESRTGHQVEQPHRKWTAGFGRGRNQPED